MSKKILLRIYEQCVYAQKHIKKTEILSVQAWKHMPKMIYSFNGKDSTMNVCIQIREIHYMKNFSEKSAVKRKQ